MKGKKRKAKGKIKTTGLRLTPCRNDGFVDGPFHILHLSSHFTIYKAKSNLWIAADTLPR